MKPTYSGTLPYARHGSTCHSAVDHAGGKTAKVVSDRYFCLNWPTGSRETRNKQDLSEQERGNPRYEGFVPPAQLTVLNYIGIPFSGQVSAGRMTG